VGQTTSVGGSSNTSTVLIERLSGVSAHACHTAQACQAGQRPALARRQDRAVALGRLGALVAEARLGRAHFSAIVLHTAREGMAQAVHGAHAEPLEADVRDLVE
jgi:hypothetical protein